MAETSGEKTFAPSAKRRREAAERGDVLRSRELTIAIGSSIGVLWLILAGPWMLRAITRVARAGLVWDRRAIEHFDPSAMLMQALITVMPPVMVLGVGVLAASLVIQLGLGDGAFMIGQVAPKASRINPANGLSRMFGPQGLIEMGKGLAKLALLGGLTWIWLRGHLARLVGLGTGQLHAQLGFAWSAISQLLTLLAVGLVLIALADFPLQWFRRMRRLRMTLQEVRDEAKETDGSPENKAAVRRRQRAIATGSIQKAMREAQFVVTTPMHFAVALAYDPDKAPAPIVVARGRGEKAAAIRELAAELALPTLEYPALARAVYYTTRENQMIREELYQAVAAVLAFVLGLRRGESPPAPRVEVPVSVRFDADGRPEIASSAASGS